MAHSGANKTPMGHVQLFCLNCEAAAVSTP